MEDTYQQYSRLMFYISKNYTANPYDQEDIVQKSVEKLMKKVDTLRRLEHKARCAYIAQCVQNTAIDHLKDEKRKMKYEAAILDEKNEVLSFSIHPEEIVQDNELRKELLEAFHALTEQDKMVLYGKYFMEISSTDLAKLLHCSSGNVRVLSHRAIQRLKKNMTK